MGWFQSPYKYFLIFLFLMLCLENINSDNNLCPRLCTCYMWGGDLRRADCVNQRLYSVHADVPQSVQVLDVSNNSISKLENYEFKNLGLTKLVYINMKCNRISSIGMHSFSELNYLQVVDLSYNFLHHMNPQTFLDTPILHALLLSNNKFGAIRSGPFLEVPSLKELDIGHCQLGMVQNDLFSRLPSLRRLNISDNQLARVEAGIFRPLTMLVELDLSKNPLSCDGITEELQQWLLQKQLTDTTACEKVEEKFAKIITAVDATIETELMDNDITKYWFESAEGSDGVEDNDNNNETKATMYYQYYSYPMKYFDFLEKIPSFWALLIGFEIGVVITMFGMYIWLRGPTLPKMQLGRPRRPLTGYNEYTWQELRTEMPDCPETPPPPYRYRSTFNL